ncbi:kinase-like domain-containing protein [Xylariaceae sp. FL1272]|nr:kinase-like domain-containing protein [Xylariaceae sp. FL1272]
MDTEAVIKPRTYKLPSLRRMGYVDAVQGEDVYNYWGNRVVKHVTKSGRVLALKVKPVKSMDRSEGDMMHHAATNGVLAPRVRCIYDVIAREPLARVMISEFVEGEPLDQAWDGLSDEQKSNIKSQLREQLARMRACTQPFIGRVGNQHVRNVFNRLGTTFCGPWASEEEFDKWCLARVSNRLSRWKWQRMLDRNRLVNPSKFVLTHGDLSPRNIMVKGGKITGIVDWETSGFFPEYAEYAFAMALGHGIENWWIPILEEILQPCSDKRLEFTGLIEDLDESE